MDMWIPKVSCPMSMHGCGVVTASKACTKAWVTCVATCDATKFRGGNLRKMEQKCSESRDNWLWSVTLIGNSGHHIYISTRMNCKTHGFLANPANKTVETSSQTHGLLRAPSPCFYCLYCLVLGKGRTHRKQISVRALVDFFGGNSYSHGILGGGFQYMVVFIPACGDDAIWVICFKWVGLTTS